jgi:hypothetical protein
LSAAVTRGKLLVVFNDSIKKSFEKNEIKTPCNFSLQGVFSLNSIEASVIA